VEASFHLARTLRHIRELGKKAGVVLNPQSLPDSLAYVLDFVDVILVMSVNPGFGGQSFMPEILPKLRILRKMIDTSGRDSELEVDGGIARGTARRVVDAGARVLVAGSAIYGHPNYGEAIRALREDAYLGLGVAGHT